jgi:hypothetical protein
MQWYMCEKKEAIISTEKLRARIVPELYTPIPAKLESAALRRSMGDSFLKEGYRGCFHGSREFITVRKANGALLLGLRLGHGIASWPKPRNCYVPNTRNT